MENIEDSMLKIMEYTEPAPECNKCAYFAEKENLYVDRSWDTVCNLYANAPGIGSLSISSNGICKYFKSKEQKG